MKERGLQWNLKDIVKDEEEFFNIIKKIEGEIQGYDIIFKETSNDMKEAKFKRMIDFQEKITTQFGRINSYVSLLSSIDSKSQKVMKYQSTLDELGIKIADKSRPINHWLQGLEVRNKKPLDDKNAKRLFKAIPDLEWTLHDTRKKAKHTLKEEIEQVIQRKNINGIDAITELYEKITTNLSFEFAPYGKEKKIIKNQEELIKYVKHPKKEYRKAAYEALLRTYKEQKETLYTIYAAVIKDWKMEQELRKYTSPINMRNSANDIEDEIIETVLKVVVKNRKIYQELFKIKAKELGMKKLSRTDIYAPLSKEEKKINFEEAKKLVLETYKNFHPEFAKRAEQVFNQEHMDSHPKENKRGGAFCAYITPQITPYILLNYTETERDVSTMAHELGHAIHDLYTKRLPYAAAHAPLPLAETASTFGEMLLFEELLKQASKKKKKELLMNKLADSYATIARQTYFIKFEKEAHEKIPRGLSEEELSKLYLAQLEELFGDTVNIPDYFQYEWLYIPHIFHTPFYCYAYSFGDLLTLALYAQYKKEGKKFIPRLERILSAGGSKNPVELLNKEGFDITKEAFWEEGFKVIRSWLEEVKTL